MLLGYFNLPTQMLYANLGGLNRASQFILGAGVLRFVLNSKPPIGEGLDLRVHLY